MSGGAREFGIALLGTGTVGGSVCDLVRENADLIAERSGVRPKVVSACARNVGRAKERTGGGVPVFADWREAVSQPGVDAAVELMGGTDEALECALACAERGLPLITANKALLATHGERLLGGGQAGGAVYFEAAVAGCIPAIRVLRDSLSGDRISSVMGIVNGTCNYILTRMSAEGIGFDEALAAATAEGYAEADPTLDIDGLDAAHKAVIMSRLAFGTELTMEGLEVRGIRGSDPADEELAAEFGYAVKLIATARREGDGSALVWVTPALVDLRHPLAKIDGSTNAVLVDSEAAGEMMLVGAGAGARPTASAVMSDIVEAALRAENGGGPQVPGANGAKTVPPHDVPCQAYVRARVLDVAGVMVKVTSILSEAGISIEGMHQGESIEGEKVDVAVLLHECKWSAAVEAAGRIAALEETVGEPAVMPIAVPHNR